MSKEMKTLNGYEVVDAKARQDIANINIPTVPENVSAFNNDAGYLTEHQSLEGYAKTTDIPDVSAFQTADQVNQLINTAIGDIENGTY